MCVFKCISVIARDDVEILSEQHDIPFRTDSAIKKTAIIPWTKCAIKNIDEWQECNQMMVSVAIICNPCSVCLIFFHHVSMSFIWQIKIIVHTQHRIKMVMMKCPTVQYQFKYSWYNISGERVQMLLFVCFFF